MKQALKALTNCTDYDNQGNPLEKKDVVNDLAIEALIEALKQEQVEPVAEVVEDNFSRQIVGIRERGMEAYEAAKERGWVGLSDERLMEMPKQKPVAYMSSTKNNQLVSKAQYDSMEGKNKSHFDIFLYDKPQPKQEQGEPVAYVYGNGDNDPILSWSRWDKSGREGWHETPLYTKPQTKEWVGLTSAELNVISDRMRTWNSFQITDVYFAIEAKLKEKNGH